MIGISLFSWVDFIICDNDPIYFIFIMGSPIHEYFGESLIGDLSLCSILDGFETGSSKPMQLFTRFQLGDDNLIGHKINIFDNIIHRYPIHDACYQISGICKLVRIFGFEYGFGHNKFATDNHAICLRKSQMRNQIGNILTDLSVSSRIKLWNRGFSRIHTTHSVQFT